MDKRHFTVVIGSKEHGLYVSSKPSSAAKKAVSKLCASNKSKKVEFCLREITQGSKKKTYGPYLGEMKKLKMPIELKGRVIRHEIKVHLKKGKSLKTVKKMRGGEENEIFTLDTNNNLTKFSTFISKNFLNKKNINRSLFTEIKTGILSKLGNYIIKRKTEPRTNREKEIRKWDIVNIFYIYDLSNNTIVSLGIITPNYESSNMNRKTFRRGKKYLYIKYLLSRIKGGGISALYHILSLLKNYDGICLHPARLLAAYYTNLGFIRSSTITGVFNDDLLILDKTPENISKLESKLPHPITTVFYSTYPDNIITNLSR
jgi:hypothetical protein